MFSFVVVLCHWTRKSRNNIDVFDTIVCHLHWHGYGFYRCCFFFIFVFFVCLCVFFRGVQCTFLENLYIVYRYIVCVAFSMPMLSITSTSHVRHNHQSFIIIEMFLRVFTFFSAHSFQYCSVNSLILASSCVCVFDLVFLCRLYVYFPAI